MSTQAEKLSQEAKRAYEQGQYAHAVELFLQAQQAFQQAGETLMAAEMANNASVAALQANDAEAALQYAQPTISLFEQAEDARRAGMAWGNTAAALEALGRLDEALDAYGRAADLLKQANEPDLRLHVMQAISALQLRTGRQLEALASMQAGLDGIAHPSPKQRFLKRLLKVPFEWLNKRFS